MWCRLYLYNYGRARYNVVKVAEYFVSLLTGVVITENIVMLNSQELIGTTDVLVAQTDLELRLSCVVVLSSPKCGAGFIYIITVELSITS